VRDAVESPQRGSVVKDHFGQERAVESSVTGEYRIAKTVAQRHERGQPRLRNVVGNIVRVNNGPTQSCQVRRNGRFPSTNPARDDNSFHLTTVATACHITTPGTSRHHLLRTVG
jgi:hypothetical protein